MRPHQLALSILLAIFLSFGVNCLNQGEIAALQAFIAATQGSLPSDWVSSNASHACDAGQVWTGLSCNSQGSLTQLVLPDFGLTGTIPVEIGYCTSLNAIDLGSNDLSGPIPSSLNNLTQLTILSLAGNFLSGSLPALPNLSRLSVYQLFSNRLSGTIPDVLFSHGSLTILNLESNQLTGNLPDQFNAFPNLRTLKIGFNHITGSIPSTVSSLTQLTEIDLSNNLLAGPIPSALGTFPNLQFVDLSANPIQSTIPNSFAGLQNLVAINISHAGLTGTIPDMFSNMGSLLSVDLSFNGLTGTMPPSILVPGSLRTLSLTANPLHLCPFTAPPNAGETFRDILQCYLNDINSCGCSSTYFGCSTDTQCPPSHCSGPAPANGFTCQDSGWTYLKSLTVTGSNLTINSPTFIQGALTVTAPNAVVFVGLTASLSVQFCSDIASQTVILNLSSSDIDSIIKADPPTKSIDLMDAGCNLAQTQVKVITPQSCKLAIATPSVARYTDTSGFAHFVLVVQLEGFAAQCNSWIIPVVGTIQLLVLIIVIVYLINLYLRRGAFVNSWGKLTLRGGM